MRPVKGLKESLRLGTLAEIIGVTFVLILVLLSQRDVWFSSRLICVHDTLRLYPVFVQFADAVQRWRLPLWDPYLETGQPFFVVSPEQIWAWQPWSLALLLLGKLLGTELLTLYHWHLFALFALFTSGSYLLFRRLFADPAPAFVAFAVLAFSSLNASYLRQIVYICNVALAPWLLLALFEAFESSSPRWLVLAAVLLGISSGSYHILTLSTFIGIVLLSLLISRALSPAQLAAALSRRRVLAFCFILFCLLASRSLSQAWYLRDFVLIQRQDMAYADSSRWADLAGLLSPYFLSLARERNSSAVSEGLLYIGMLPLLLALIGMRFSRHRYRGAFLLSAAFTLLLMLGRNTPAYRLLQFLPTFLLVRNTTDFHAFFLLCLCFFVGCGTATLLGQGDSKRTFPPASALWGLAAGMTLAAIILTAMARVGISIFNPDSLSVSTPQVEIAARLSWANIIVFGAAAALLLCSRRRLGPNVLLLLLVTFSLPDLLMAGAEFLRISTVERQNLWVRVPRRALAPDRYSQRRIPSLAAGHLFNLPSLTRQFSAYHQPFAHFVELKSSFDLRRLGSSPALDIAAAVTSDKLRTVESAVVLEREEIFREIPRTEPRSLRNFIFLEEELPERFKALQTTPSQAAAAPATAGRATLLSFQANELVAEADCPKDCLLYYSDAFHRSWRAFVDGRPSRIYRANLNFKAVPLPQGRHQVRFEYRPSLYLAALGLYGLGLLASAAALAWTFHDPKYI